MSRVVILTVHRQDRSVTSLLVPVYLGVYQDGGVIHVQNPVTNTVHRQDRSVTSLLVPVCMGVYQDGGVIHVHSPVTNTVHRKDRSVTSLTVSVSPVSLVTGEELVIRTAACIVQNRDVVCPMESVLIVWLEDGDLNVIRSVTNTVHRQGQICDISTGTCLSGCVPGWWGDTCTDSCNQHCTGQGCGRSDGICLDCVAGRWGPVCDKICYQHCNQTCDVSNGQCVSGCNPGHWDDLYCNKTCNEHCIQTGQICDVSNGTCLSGCKERGAVATWFTGDTCDITIRP